MRFPEARELFRVGWPSVVSSVLSQITGLTTVFFVGGLDDAFLLGSVGLGAMAQNVFGFSLGMGLNSALSTLVSQSHGAGEHELSGVYLRQAQLLSLSVSMPCIAGLWFASHFFRLVGINPRTAQDAGDYVRGTLPTMPLYFLYTASNYFLCSAKITRPNFFVNIFVGLLHPLWCVLFLKWLDWGALGAGLTVSCSNGLRFLLLTGYIIFCMRPGPLRQAWHCCPCRGTRRRSPGESTWSLQDYLRVALPSALLMWSEWWVYEIMSLLAGLCGTDGLAAHTAVCNVLLVLFMVPSALSSATSALVGNAVGAGDAPKVHDVIRTASTFIVIAFIVLAGLVLGLRKSLAHLFNTDPQVVATFQTLCLVMAPFIIVDSLQTVLEGALMGLGLQRKATQVKLVSMIGVRLLGACLLALVVKLGVLGIWIGSLSGMVVTLALYLLIVCCADVPAIAAGVQQRLRSFTQQDTEMNGDLGK